MSAVRNDNLRNSIRSFAKKVRSLPRDVQAQMLRDEFGMTTQRIAYYLREPGVDRRLVVDRYHLRKLSLDDAEGIAACAARFDVTEDAIRRALRRYKEPQGPETPRQKVQHQGYFSWQSKTETLAADVTPAEVSLARRVLRNSYNLTLEAPNILKHKPSGRFYRMSLKEQKALTADPRGFIWRNLKRIAKNWEREE